MPPVIARARRIRLQEAIEHAIELLDAIDGDPDFEQDAGDESEIVSEDEGAQCDDEGAPEWEGAHHG